MQFARSLISLGFLALVTGSLTGCGPADAGDALEGAPAPGSAEPIAELEQQTIPGAAVNQVSRTYGIGVGQTLTDVWAECPAGSVLVGGGQQVSPDTQVFRSRSNYNRWLVSAINLGASGGTVNVVAECLSGTSATGHLSAQASATLGPGETKCATNWCPSGTIMTGGGFSSTLQFRVLSATPTAVANNTTVRYDVCGSNSSASQSITLSSIANCIGGVTGKPETVFLTANNTQPWVERKIEVWCANGWLLTTGGIYNQDLESLLLRQSTRNFQIGSNKWTIVFTPQTTNTIAARALCWNFQ